MNLNLHINDIETRGDGKEVSIFYSTNEDLYLDEFIRRCGYEFMKNVKIYQIRK